MKKLRFVSKTIFLINVVFALLLLLSYRLPYFLIKNIPSLSVLSLVVPVFIFVNLIFLIYWVLRRKRYFIISFIALLISYQQVFSFYKVSGNENESQKHELSLLSYNVRLFNVFKWINDDSIALKISELIKKEDPDILSLQEFYYEKEAMFNYYPYSYIKYKTKNQKTGQAIFSKYPIINKGSLEFPNTANNAIYIDIVKEKDTIRIYNLHMESFHINAEEENINQENSGRLLNRMSNSFAIQQKQAILFNKHQEKCAYRKVITGDFNNTEYSYIYKKIKGNLKDTFEEAGKGFGKTFNFRYFPVRIDFILVDKTIDVVSHKNFEQRYSDHFPIATSLNL